MVCDICGSKLPNDAVLASNCVSLLCHACGARIVTKRQGDDDYEQFIELESNSRARAAEIRKAADTTCRPRARVSNELYEAATELCNRIAGLRDPLLSPGEVRNLVKPLKNALSRYTPREQMPSELYEAAKAMVDNWHYVRDSTGELSDNDELVMKLEDALSRCAPRGNCGDCGCWDCPPMWREQAIKSDTDHECRDRHLRTEPDMSCPDWRKAVSDDTRRGAEGAG